MKMSVDRQSTCQIRGEREAQRADIALLHTPAQGDLRKVFMFARACEPRSLHVSHVFACTFHNRLQYRLPVIPAHTLV